MSITVVPGVNYVRYSGKFNAASWITTNAAVQEVTSQQTGPNLYVFRVLAASTVSDQGVYQANIPEYQVLSLYSTTIWFKPETWTQRLYLIMQSSDGNAVGCQFDPTNPANAPVVYAGGPGPQWTSPAATITALTGGWYSITLQGVTNSIPNLALGVFIKTIATVGLTPVGQSFLLAGATLYLGLNSNYVDTQASPQANALALFNFPNHKIMTKYPSDAQSIQFGSSYVYTVKPNGPPQRVFTLRFKGMKWRFNSDGSVDNFTDPQNNMGTLEEFYKAVSTWAPFYFIHQKYGRLVVRFSKPLEIPETFDDSPNSVLQVVSIELIEAP